MTKKMNKILVSVENGIYVYNTYDFNKECYMICDLYRDLDICNMGHAFTGQK
jgi:hypothetical protein